VVGAIVIVNVCRREEAVRLLDVLTLLKATPLFLVACCSG
jgi:hypothetical protein